MIPGARHAYQWIAYEKKIRFALSLSLLAQKLAKIAFLEVSCEILEFENSKKNHFSKSAFFMMFFKASYGQQMLSNGQQMLNFQKIRKK